jgi:hypothetical protein
MVIQSKAVLQVGYGFGDASGKGFVSTIQLNDEILWRAGQWVELYCKEYSNRHESENIVITLECYAREYRDTSVELIKFTDNFMTECAYFRRWS